MRSRRPFLITVSGVAGSGKSSAVREIISILENAGERVEFWRFRTLPCFRFLGRGGSAGSRNSDSAVPHDNGSERIRWTGFQRRPLTARRTLGYLARMGAFALFRWRDGGTGYRITDRYFYDNFPQFTMNGHRQRVYRRVLQWAMPRPDLAFLMMASPATLIERRSDYSREYFNQLVEAYRELGDWCDGVVVVSTEPGQDASRIVTEVVTQRALRTGRDESPASASAE